jgi:hypothetical protein
MIVSLSIINNPAGDAPSRLFIDIQYAVLASLFAHLEDRRPVIELDKAGEIWLSVRINSGLVGGYATADRTDFGRYAMVRAEDRHRCRKCPQWIEESWRRTRD